MFSLLNASVRAGVLVLVDVVVVVGTPFVITSWISGRLKARSKIAASSILPVRLLFVPLTCMMVPSIQPSPTGLSFNPTLLPL